MSRKKIIFIGYAFMIIGYFVFSARSAGVAEIISSDATGSPLSEGLVCGDCHSGGSFNSMADLQILDGNTPVTSYIPGQTYTMTLQISGTAPHYGGQAVALKSDNTNAGMMGVPTTPDTQVEFLGNVSYLEQSARSSSGIFTTTWTAPAAGSGNVNIHYIGNAVNGQATAGDDPTDPMMLTLTEIPTCVEIPTNHSVVMTSPTTALFDWDDMAEADFYQVWHRNKGEANPFTIASSTTSQKSLNVFQNKKFYQYKIRARCTNGIWSPFTEVITWYSSQCSEPTGVAVTFTDLTRMRVRWDANPDEIKAKIRYRVQGTTEWITQNSQDGQNFLFVNSLPSGTTVDYKMRSNCDGNDWSAYSSPLQTVTLEAPLRVSNVISETTIYPNPAKDVLNVDFETITVGDVQLVITDMRGKQLMIQNNTYEQGYNKERLDINNLSSGYYFLTVYSGNDVNTMKFVKY
jgi:hypothetical protein